MNCNYNCEEGLYERLRARLTKEFGIASSTMELVDAIFPVIRDIIEERKRQRELGFRVADKHSNGYNDWVAYITAYAGRAANCVRNDEGRDFRENMVKVAALAMAAIEAYDHKWFDGKIERGTR